MKKTFIAIQRESTPEDAEPSMGSLAESESSFDELVLAWDFGSERAGHHHLDRAVLNYQINEYVNGKILYELLASTSYEVCVSEEEDKWDERELKIIKEETYKVVFELQKGE